MDTFKFFFFFGTTTVVGQGLRSVLDMGKMILCDDSSELALLLTANHERAVIRPLALAIPLIGQEI